MQNEHLRRRYTSFEEINHDLRILKLQKEIQEEQMKLNAKEVMHSLSPTSIATSTLSSIGSSINGLVSKVINWRF